MVTFKYPIHFKTAVDNFKPINYNHYSKWIISIHEFYDSQFVSVPKSLKCLFYNFLEI